MKGQNMVSDAPYVSLRIRDWAYIPPTGAALPQFTFKTQHPLTELPESEPTSDAAVEFSYYDVDRKFRSKVNVPGKFTDNLLDTLIVTIGVVGTVAAPVAILKLASGSLPSELLFALCIASVVAVGGLTRSVTKRRRG
ncbi:hypothetical protein ACWIF8_29195 [Micromonospora chalcea]|uniref:hypothetical protein n=1 Tax=Micromonospora sp. B006 TaxID=2201999 RepID=UPI000E301AC1|nr:hypothetical protein [Micromonospora sp. B006]AXO32465.1 hypothetical protein MicB006_0153 [Micromonospora sp. B006]